MSTISQNDSLSYTASTLPARQPGWATSLSLQAANEQIAPQMTDWDSISAADLRGLTHQWLRRELAFICNPDFSQRGEGDRVFADDLELIDRTNELGVSALRKAGIDLPVHLSRLCEAPLLTPLQERQLFERMNFLLHQASIHRSLLNPSRPSKARLKLIERFVLLAEWHRDRIVEANLRLVISIVKKFVNLNNSFDDLLSEGIMGLIRSVEKFDFGRGFRFSTYATQVVRRNSYKSVVANHEERQKVSDGLQDMNIDISEDEHCSAFTEQRWHDLRSRLETMLDQVDRREKLIIRSRFALGSHRRVRTLQSLADRLGISKERVRQLERRAMEKLQAMAQEMELPSLQLAD
ncbi:MAG: sigma-70 family RNA polymerase sigma factor [Rubripirellula sp.]